MTALVIAAGDATVGSSPMPFAPSGFKGDRVSRVSKVKSGMSWALGMA